MKVTKSSYKTYITTTFTQPNSVYKYYTNTNLIVMWKCRSWIETKEVYKYAYLIPITIVKNQSELMRILFVFPFWSLNYQFNQLFST